MIGRDIKIDVPKESNVPKRFNTIYMNELISMEKLRNNFKRLPSPVQIQMEPIRARTSFGKYLVHFTSTSTIHGLNHLTASRRHIFERFLIVVVIIGALVGLILLSSIFWKRYEDDSVVIVIDHMYRQFTISVPALIVCPIKRINEEKFPEVFKKYGLEDTNDTRNFFNFISNATYFTFNQTPKFNAINPDKWLSILNDLKYDIDYYGNTEATWIVTEFGLCFTFDSVVSTYSSFEYWQNNNWTVTTSQMSSLNYWNREITNQIRIKNHNVMFGVYYSSEIINFDQKLYKGDTMSITTVKIEMIEVGGSTGLKELPIRQRKCKLSNDGGLTMWPIYSPNMCNLECRFKRIFKYCHCYPHFARLTPGIPICNATQLRCISEKWSKIYLSKIESKEKCGCLWYCDTASYDIKFVSIYKVKETAQNEAVINRAVIFPLDKYERMQIFEFNDLWASIGGAAGLFLGASVISFMEIFYFATLRLYWYRNHIQREKKKRRIQIHH